MNPQEPPLDKRPGSDASTPGTSPPASSFWGQLLYGLSLPERAMRSTTALVGGTVHEAGEALLPQVFRSSRTYTVFIQQSLDFILTQVGSVKRPAAASDSEASDQSLLAKKAVGSFLDLAGLATLHLSPMTVLALVSDIAYGSSTYLRELSAELQAAGVLDQQVTIENATDFLDAVRHASLTSSQVFDTPPLSVEGLKETIAQTTAAVRQIDLRQILPQSELQQMWDSIREVAGREGVSPFEVSSTLALYSLGKVGVLKQGALSSISVAGNLFERHIFDHYRTGLDTIRSRGMFTLLAENYQPYVAAVWTNFSSTNVTLTEELLSGRLMGRAWDKIRGAWRQPD